MQRVMIIGQPGAGKSTLARRLGAALDLPVVHIDQFHWKEGWIERDAEERDKLCREAHAQDAWIIEGGNSPTWRERIARCDTLIWIDIPVWARLWRICKRTIRHKGRSRADMPANCPESFDMSFLKWVWTSRKQYFEMMQTAHENVPRDKTRHRFRSLRAVNAFIKSQGG
ncbi:ATPase AAA [Litorivita sp. NS0012-18]